MSTTRLSDDVLATAEIVGAHPEPSDELEPAPKTTKVVTAKSKGVRAK